MKHEAVPLFGKLSVVAILILLILLPAQAQISYGRITGRVADPAGAFVPGASIRAVATETNVATSTKSNAEGNFELLNLVPGPYLLSVDMDGFKHYQRGPMEVQAERVVNIPVVLEVGARTEAVTVTAEAPLLESASATLAQDIARRQLIDMPIPAGSVLYLMQVDPNMISTSTPTQTWGPEARNISSAYVVDGAVVGTHEFTFDGITAERMESSNVIAMLPPPEAVEQVHVETAPADASIGHFTGAHVDIVMKSGTNQVHGAMLFLYSGRPLMSIPFFTDQAVNALSPGPAYQQEKNTLWPSVRNQRYRGTIGGPVFFPHLYNGHNRTFWQFTMDYLDRYWPGGTYSTVPTVPERSGDFSSLLALGSQYQIYDPATIAPAAGGHFSSAPFPGNVIPASRLDPTALKILSLYPLPNSTATATSTGLDNYAGSPDQWLGYTAGIGRIDQIVNPKYHFFLSLNFMNQNETQSTFSNYATGTRQYPLQYRGLGFDNAVILRPNLVLDLRYGLTHYHTGFYPLSVGYNLNNLGISPSLIDQLNPELTSVPGISIQGMTALGGGTCETTGEITHQVTGVVTYVRGTHTLRMGGEGRVMLDDQYPCGNLTPSYTYGSTYTVGPLNTSAAAPIGQGMASFLLGIPTSGSIVVNSSLAQAGKYYAGFFQDDWKVTRRLTVNLGLRYEIEVPVTERYNRANRGFDFTAANPIQSVAQANYAQAPIPQIPVGDFKVLGGLQFAGVNGVPTGMWNTNPHNFSPRIGLAYQLGRNTVVRSGYGIFFAPNGLGNVTSLVQDGFSATTPLVPTLNNGQTFIASTANPFPNGLIQPSGASGGLTTYLGQAPSYTNPDLPNSYMQRWTLTIQHQFPGRIVIELGYTGNRGTHLALSQGMDATPAQYLSTLPVRDQATINTLSAVVANPFYGISQFANTGLASATTTVAQLLTPYPEFTGIGTTTDQGYSWFHSGYVYVEKRFQHGLSVQSSFTWSKFMDASQKLNPTDPVPEQTISSSDRPQHLGLSGMWELPFGSGKPLLGHSPKLLNQVVGGWSIQAMYQAEVGAPLSWGNIAFYGDIHNIPLPGDKRTIQEWFNTSAGFATAASAQLADNIRTFPLGLNGARAPGINNWDLSLFKNFRIREGLNFQLRGEGQDAFNHPTFAAPNTTPTSALFGQITATTFTEQRKIFVGGRLTW